MGLEPVLHQRSRWNEEPVHSDEEQSPLTTTREKPAQQQRLSTAKVNKITFFQYHKMTDTEELPAACETVSSPVFVTLLLQLSAAPVLNCFSLCDPMDCSLPGSSVRGILQARVLEWVAMPSPRGSSPPVSYVSGIGRQLLYH